MIPAGSTELTSSGGAIGACELQVGLAGGSLSHGWHELVLSGVDAEAGRKLLLTLTVGRGTPTLMEMALPAVLDGSLRQILHLDLPVQAARLSADIPMRCDLAAVLRPLGRLGVLVRGFERDREQTLTALRWRLVGKKVRARNMLMRLFGLPRRMAYEAWRNRNEAAWRDEVDALASRSSTGSEPSQAISVLIHSCRGEQPSKATAASIATQLREVAEVRSVDRSQPLDEAIKESRSDWIILLPDGHTLAEDAVLRIGSEAAEHPTPSAITWDSDRIDGSGRHTEPELKPQWNEALYLARDYVGPFAIARGAIERGVARLSGLPLDLADAFLLAASRSGTGPIRHIPRILSSRIGAADTSRGSTGERRRLVEAFVRHENNGASARIEPGEIIRVSFPIASPAPLVSLIVPTRDRVDLLEPCVDSLLRITDYERIEILIADNGSSQPATQRYFDSIRDEPRVQIIDCAGPFNFAAINNKAVAAAKGSVLGFINNDVEASKPDWLTETVGHALRPRIGAVGARLLYASGLVQHAGVILGLGGYAGHAHRFAHPQDWGYLGRLQCQQHYAAVTAACLVVERSKFEAVGGFDAEAFPVAYNDVDLCLRLRAAGYETMWTPYAELLHKESASRVRDHAPERRAAYDKECAAFLARWGDLIKDDPYYHPALSRTLENFSLE